MMRISAVWSSEVLAHVPETEIWVGVRTPGTEVPERAHILRDAISEAGGRMVPAVSHDDTVLAKVHDAGLLRHLANVYEDWVAAGFPEYPGQPTVVPYVFPTDAFLDGLPVRDPVAVHARAGKYCYDTMTLVGPGTWRAARAAVDAALTAASLITAGERATYAICRPPGHHATRSAFGGSCYLNNAAVAAEALRAGGLERVAVLDVDAHHGNGTQAIFYERADVWYGSVHVDPAAGWFPHYAGFADETGRGAGLGTNRNIPMPPEAGDDLWLAGVAQLCEEASAFGADAVVLSLGVDAAADDPESPLRITMDGYRATGSAIGALGLPVVAVHEGGYHLPTLGQLTVATLSGVVVDSTG